MGRAPLNRRRERGAAGREKEAWQRQADDRLAQLDTLPGVHQKLDLIASALTVLLDAARAEKEKPKMPNPKADELIAKVTAKKSVFDGLVVARDALKVQLEEARNATGMQETNAAIDTAIAMLDTLVDPAEGTSPIIENTPAE